MARIAAAATRLHSRLDRPFRAHGDWSIELPADGCACELCGVLYEFLADPSRRALEWPLAEDRLNWLAAKWPRTV
jgi:hypothetical protein